MSAADKGWPDAGEMIPGVVTDPKRVDRTRRIFNATCEAGRTAQSVGHAVELLRTCGEARLGEAAGLAAALAADLARQLNAICAEVVSHEQAADRERGGS